MNQEKTFDCVAMKWEIQERHRREVEAVGKEEARKRRWQRVLDDPVLREFVRANPPQRPGEPRQGREEAAAPATIPQP